VSLPLQTVFATGYYGFCGGRFEPAPLIRRFLAHVNPPPEVIWHIVAWVPGDLFPKGLLINLFHESRSNSSRMPRSSPDASQARPTSGAIQREIYRRSAGADGTSRDGGWDRPSRWPGSAHRQVMVNLRRVAALFIIGLKQGR
jgi:hypothetical protein